MLERFPQVYAGICILIIMDRSRGGTPRPTMIKTQGYRPWMQFSTPQPQLLALANDDAPGVLPAICHDRRSRRPWRHTLKLDCFCSRLRPVSARASALASLAEQRRQAGSLVAWLSLGSEDDDPARFS